MASTTRQNTKKAKAINGEIQIGLNTQIQDHSIYPVSFNPIKSVVSNPINPLLPTLLLVAFFVISFPFQIAKIISKPTINQTNASSQNGGSVDSMFSPFLFCWESAVIPKLNAIAAVSQARKLPIYVISYGQQPRGLPSKIT